MSHERREEGFLSALLGGFYAAEAFMWSRAGERRMASVRAMRGSGAETGSPEEVVDLYADLLHAVISLDQAMRVVEAHPRARPAGLDWDRLHDRVTRIRNAVIHEDERIEAGLNIALKDDEIVCRAGAGRRTKETRLSLSKRSPRPWMRSDDGLRPT